MKIVGNFVVANADENWNSISLEKTDENRLKVVNYFDLKINDLINFGYSYANDKTVIDLIVRDESNELLNYLLSKEIPSSRSIEVMNRRLESLGFRGRDIPYEYYLLQQSLNGDTISVLKEMGFNTFLLAYLPIKDQGTNQIIGVVVAAELADINSRIKSKFFRDKGFTEEINKITSTSCEIYPANSITHKVFIDSNKLTNKTSIDIFGLNGSLLCVLLLENINKFQYLQDISLLETRIISILYAIFSIILVYIVTKLLNIFPNSFFKISLLAVFLLLLRFTWLQIGFPTDTINSELFSPVYFASTFGWGVVRSLGELLITTLFVLFFAFYLSLTLIKKSRICLKVLLKMNAIKLVIVSLIITIAALFLIDLYGTVIQSIIFDSNINYLEKLRIIPSSQLFVIQSVVLIITFTLLVLISALIIFNINLCRKVFRKRGFKRNLIFIFFITYLSFNQFLEPLFSKTGIDYMQRLLIITLVFIFAFIYLRLDPVANNLKFLSLKNFSFLFLICIIVTPTILLQKIISQETSYVRLIGQKISENEDERINFILVDELSNLVNTPDAESFFIDLEKQDRLAFYLWAESKLSSENYLVSVMVLDTNFQSFSDFNFEENLLNKDSVINFLKQNLLSKGYQIGLKEVLFNPSESDTTAKSDYWEDEINTSGENAPFIFGNIAILKNDDENYFVGIAPMEKLKLRNTIFESKIGYLLLTVQYETKNFLEPTKFDIFKTQTRDNLLDKLISRPVITEYVNGQVVSSNDPDLAKIASVSLDRFREQVRYSNDKTGWRIENFDDEKYRIFYVLNESVDDNGQKVETIYTVSLKRDDVQLAMFYFLKFILFSVSLYVFSISILVISNLPKLRTIKFNFREKLFFFISRRFRYPDYSSCHIYQNFLYWKKNEESLKNQMVSDLNFINQTVKLTEQTEPEFQNNDELFFTKLSGIFGNADKNFNLYIKSKLVATTNEELYKSDLLDSRLDEEAYYNIVHQRRELFIKTQDIGTLSYLVGYEPYYDASGKMAGIVSSQLVYKQNEINEELTKTLTFILGIYILTIIGLLILVSYFSTRMSLPILELKRATEKLSRGGNPSVISLEKNDEIGDLIKSFNKMTQELDRSRTELKKAEREAAWRDIARRVAHEIKNPLTPIKLSIQHLVDVYNKNGISNFESVLKKTEKLISNEIDKLSKIATEFSNFAKLPSKNYEVLNVNEVLSEVISLYSADENVKFEIDFSSLPLYIIADKQELNRVFQNLIKNSFQSFGGSNGVIKVRSFGSNNLATVIIKDNGCGMSEEILNNLFEPNFSTKTTGMGLGLTITKKALDDMKASITFDSKLGSGTTVELKFGLVKGNKESKQDIL